MAAISLFIAGGLAAATIATDRVAAAREARAVAAHPPSGRFIEVDGRQVHAFVAGSGPDLVLIHGANGSIRDFTFDLIPRLTDRYRVIAFDRPGLGYTDRTRAAYARAFAADAESPIEQAALLSAAARQLGVTRPIVLGHSFGGIVALAWALEADAAALVMLAGVANPWPGKLDPLYRLTGNALGGGLLVPPITAYTPQGRIRDGIEGVFAPNPAPEGYADHMGVDMFLRRDVFRANARQVNTLRPHVVQMVRRYETLDLPIEILHGAEDETVPLPIHSGPLAERLDTVHLTVLPGVGHMPHHTDPEATLAAIDRAARRAGLR